MAKWIGLCLMFNTLVIYMARVSGECTDSVTRKNPIIVRDPEDQNIVKATLTNCMQLVNKFPDLCELTASDPANMGAIVGGEGGLCCKACGDPNCLNKVTKDAKLTVGKASFSSCKMAVKKFPVLCKTEGVMGGQCCRYCKEAKIDVSCLDDLTQFEVEAGKLINCAKFVKGDKCRCDRPDVKEACCKSCAKVDTEALGCKCRDFLSAKNPAEITITDLDDNVVVNTKVSKCSEIIKKWAWNCDRLGGDGKACCKSCQGVDTSCQDNVLWKGTHGKCVDCGCHDFARNKNRMTNACKKDIKGSNTSQTIRKACCLQCSRVGF